MTENYLLTSMVKQLTKVSNTVVEISGIKMTDLEELSANYDKNIQWNR